MAGSGPFSGPVGGSGGGLLELVEQKCAEAVSDSLWRAGLVLRDAGHPSQDGRFAFAVGLTCGGTINLFIEPLDW